MFINQYLSEVKENTYRITFSEDDIKKIKKYIIHEKNIYSKPLTIDDLYLIRITTEENIPRNMTYFPIDYRNGYHYIRNPFCFILGFKEFNMKGYENIDFGGEVERGLSMVDGVVLLCDAAVQLGAHVERNLKVLDAHHINRIAAFLADQRMFPFLLKGRKKSCPLWGRRKI